MPKIDFGGRRNNIAVERNLLVYRKAYNQRYVFDLLPLRQWRMYAHQHTTRTVMSRILIEPALQAKRVELWHEFQQLGYEVILNRSSVQPEAADIALIDLTGGDTQLGLAALEHAEWPVNLPIIVLADTPPRKNHHLTVAGWLAAPFQTLEVIGAVRAALDARAAMNGQGDLAAVRTQLATTERERDDFESADQKKDEFISYISHELKNPMASIKGYSDLLRRRSSKVPDDPNRKGLEIISSQVGRMTLLLDQLLDFSRISMDRLQLELHAIDLVSIVERLAEESQSMTDRHVLQLVAETRPLITLGDENRLRQAMQYLLGNAIKFSPQSGTIVLTLTIDEHHANVAISDKGIGIPAEDQERIFERFERASNVDEQTPGMGLGLFLANELIARHGGIIALKSALGEGSTFTVKLPVAA